MKVGVLGCMAERLKSQFLEEEKATLKEHSTKQTDQAAPATLGDLIKAQMQSKE